VSTGVIKFEFEQGSLATQDCWRDLRENIVLESSGKKVKAAITIMTSKNKVTSNILISRYYLEKNGLVPFV
jgi:hypothetical protein